MDAFMPRFDWLKNKYKNYIREDYYFDILLQADLQMFQYRNLPESIDSVWLEKYLLVAGSVGIVKSGEDYLVAAAPARCGQLDQYGDGTELAGACCNGLPVMGKIGDTAALIYNRSNRLPELDNMIDASALKDIDKSSSINVILSRSAPVVSCSNDNTLKKIDAMLDEIIQGSVKAILSESITEGMMPEGGLQMLDVTHPEKIQYIQYLTQYYDAVLRRHYNRRGLQIRSGTKQAQQSTSEIFGFDSIAWVLPLARLEARQKGFEMFNRIFNENVQVSFSEIWQQEYDAYLLRTLQQDTAADAAAEGVVNDAEGNDTEGSSETDPE